MWMKRMGVEPAPGWVVSNAVKWAFSLCGTWVAVPDCCWFFHQPLISKCSSYRPKWKGILRFHFLAHPFILTSILWFNSLPSHFSCHWLNRTLLFRNVKTLHCTFISNGWKKGCKIRHIYVMQIKKILICNFSIPFFLILVKTLCPLAMEMKIISDNQFTSLITAKCWGWISISTWRKQTLFLFKIKVLQAN